GGPLLDLVDLRLGLGLDVGLLGHGRHRVAQLLAGALDVAPDLLRRALVRTAVYRRAACARCFVHCTSSFVLSIACSGAGGVASCTLPRPTTAAAPATAK